MISRCFLSSRHLFGRSCPILHLDFPQILDQRLENKFHLALLTIIFSNMFKTSVLVVGILAFASAAFASSDSPTKPSVKGSHIDSDIQGFPYVPITCHHASQCRCREAGYGSPHCSRCPDDRGSRYRYQNVCWCKDVFWQKGRNECNPLKNGGPQEVGDIDSTRREYRPLRCYRKNQCACQGRGEPQCSWCPDDGGSKNKYNNVCWCKGIYWGWNGKFLGSHGNECNQFKEGGPSQIY